MAHTYLLRVDSRVVERPQYLYMRVAVMAHRDDLALVLATYDALSRHLFTPASPVLYNAGTRSRNHASCFLYAPVGPTLSAQLQSVPDLDALWLADGGIGLSLAEVPAKRQVLSASRRSFLDAVFQGSSCPTTWYTANTARLRSACRVYWDASSETTLRRDRAPSYLARRRSSVHPVPYQPSPSLSVAEPLS